MMRLNTKRYRLDNGYLVNSTGWSQTFQALLSAILLILFSSSAFAYSSYDGCKNCHGDFNGDDYVSKKDGSNWGTDLMSGHEAFVSGTCNACHKDGSRGEVFLNVSKDPTPP